MTSEQLISEIRAFAAAKDIAPATVTSRAVGNSRLFSRLEAGGSCTLAVAAKVRSFIVQNSSPSLCSTDGASPKEVGAPDASFKGEPSSGVPQGGAA